MNYIKATNEQLKTIISSDHTIPTHLLGGVVEEMLNRNLFDPLIQRVIRVNFTSVPIACGVLHTTLEDMQQTAREEIWNGINLYQPGKSNFIYFAFLKLKSMFRDWEVRMKAEKRETLNQTISYETQTGENLSLYDVLPTFENVEKKVVNRIMVQQWLSPLSEVEKEAFLLYAKGYSTKEIAEMKGLNKSGANRRLKRALKRLSGREMNLKEELGNGNFKRGA